MNIVICNCQLCEMGISKLPTEVLISVISCLGMRDKLSCLGVSRHWNKFIRDNHLYKDLEFARGDAMTRFQSLYLLSPTQTLWRTSNSTGSRAQPKSRRVYLVGVTTTFTKFDNTKMERKTSKFLFSSTTMESTF